MDAKKRQMNWTEKEKCVLVEEVGARDEILFGKLKGCGVGGVSTAEKENAWKEVAVAVNAVSNTARTIDQMKKQHSNIKQRAKERYDAIKRPKTGGGPKPPSPSPSQSLLLDNLIDKATLDGFVGGIDTDDLVVIPPTHADSDCLSALVPECSYKNESINKKDSEKNEKRSLKRKFNDIEKENILLDNDRLRMSIKKLTKEEEKLKHEINYLLLKQQYLQLKIQSEFPSLSNLFQS